MPFPRQARTSLIIVSLAILVLLPTTSHAVESSSLDIPQVLGEHFKSEEIAEFIDDRQLVLLHQPQTVKTDFGKKEARFVSTMVVIDTKMQVVRNTIKDYNNYTKIHPSMRQIEITSDSPDATAVKFHYEMDLNFFSPTLIYTLEYRDGEGNDIIWKRLSGDLHATRGRWEFKELPGDRTLLSYTGWGDFTGLGLMIDTILWAQPALKLAIPVSGSAVVVRNFKEHLTRTRVPKKTGELARKPDVPLFSERPVPEQLIDMSSLGTPLIIHPGQQIRDVSGDTLTLRFVSGMGMMDAPYSTAKDLMTRYEKVSDFVNQVSSVKSRKTDTGYMATWYVSVGFGPLSVGFDYRLSYEWKNDEALVFERIAGDLDHVYGAQELISYQNDKTLYFLTSAHEIGERASYLVKMGNLLPNRQIAVGVAFAGIGVERHIKWANEQIEQSNSSSPDEGFF